MFKRSLVFAGVVLGWAILLSPGPARSTGPTQPAHQQAKTRSGPIRAATFELTVDSIMRGPKLVGYPPSALRWSADSREVYFEWRHPGEEEASTYAVGRDGGEPRKLSDEDRKKVPPIGGVWDSARRRVLFVEDGDIVLVDAASRTRQQITRTSGAEANPRWARGETAVTFTRDNNLSMVALGEGAIRQLTDVVPRKREARDTDSQKYLKSEEQKLIEYTRTQAEQKRKAEEKRKKDALPQFELQEGQTVQDLALAPDGDHVFMVVVSRASGAKAAEVPSYVTESAYTENIPARAFVGDAQDLRRLAILNLKAGASVWADASFAGKRRVPDAQPGAGGATKEADREVRWSTPIFSKNGRFAVAVVRAADFKDRWIVRVDPESGKSQVLDAIHDDAWVLDGGRGFGGGSGGIGWMPDERRVWFLSERDGWMHLYTLDASEPGSPAKQLTSGRFEVSGVTISADKRRFYFTSTEKHPGERHLYSMALEGGERAQITSMTGANLGVVSPDDSTIALVYSYTNKPPEVYLMPNQKGAAARRITTTPTEEWRSFNWADARVLTFKARDGADVYARLFTPEMLGARRDPASPGIVFVHGAGYAQNAHKYWSTYYREYMFDNLLASRGYVVLDVDYRASSGYGRDWRTAIYRHMGGKDLDDVVDGARFLVENQKVDAKRVGVFGGSYGGFITLMAMFTSPDTFAAGAAMRPVTDWAHYNHSYTASILNEPQSDSEAYRKSSPIYFAEGLKGALLICHGIVDTNVHFQDSVRLAQRLIELRKQNWELAVYPVENHGFEQETSWADEYKRILKLFEDNLRLSPARPATSR
jgi:dipeptidyl aminopeptidase/acylaminoacyl peptidase